MNTPFVINLRCTFLTTHCVHIYVCCVFFTLLCVVVYMFVSSFICPSLIMYAVFVCISALKGRVDSIPFLLSRDG